MRAAILSLKNSYTNFSGFICMKNKTYFSYHTAFPRSGQQHEERGIQMSIIFFPIKPFQLLIITNLWFADPKFLAHHSSRQWSWVNPNFSWNRFSYVEFLTCTHSSKTKINLHKWRQKLIYKSQMLQKHEKLTSLMLGNETNRISQISLKNCVNRANN